MLGVITGSEAEGGRGSEGSEGASNPIPLVYIYLHVYACIYMISIYLSMCQSVCAPRCRGHSVNPYKGYSGVNPIHTYVHIHIHIHTHIHSLCRPNVLEVELSRQQVGLTRG